MKVMMIPIVYGELETVVKDLESREYENVIIEDQ